MSKLIYSFMLSMVVVAAHSQPVQTSFEDWDLTGAETEEVYVDGQAGLKMKGQIFLMNADFKDGVIEVDIHFEEKRFFPAVEFRVQPDKKDFEHFYVRPHQSGNPDANQYSPVFDGTSAWQLYHGPEFAKPINYEFGTWHHLKIDVRGDAVKIYFDNLSEPIIYTQLLGRFGAGGFGLTAGGEFVTFANFTYEKKAGSTFAEPVATTRELPSTLISSWEVSEVVGDAMFEGSTLDPKKLKSLEWTVEETEYTGSINVSRSRARSEGNNTVLLRKTITSEMAQMKTVDFGYSDIVTVFLNGKALYSGTNQFRSRDYRYLGTIGFFDTVHLDLDKGDNELIFVLREAFGGWGLQAKLADVNGIVR